MGRREFMKFLGAGAAILAFGIFGGFGSFIKPAGIQKVSAQQLGAWALGPRFKQFNAIHATMLPTGKILYISGNMTGTQRMKNPVYVGLFDPVSGDQGLLGTLPTLDPFCAGHTHMPNGNVLVTGGTLAYPQNSCSNLFTGHSQVFVFNPFSEQLTVVSSMAHGRWYPTCVTLPNGKVLVMDGFDEFGVHNQLSEIYDPNANSWTIVYNPKTSVTYCVGNGVESLCPGAGSPCYGGLNNGCNPKMSLYPRAQVMPDGRVLVCGMSTTLRLYSSSTGVWTSLGNSSISRDYGASVLLPLNNTTSERGKVMLVGGSPTPSDPATRIVEILDFNAGTSSKPVVRHAQSITYGRKYLVPVILPNGKVMIIGGSAKLLKYPIFVPEMFDPQTETWTTLPLHTVPRDYHSTALLMQDGRVWTGGSTPAQGVFELRTELYMPDYYFETRPTITGVQQQGGYGGTITIQTPDAPNIDSVSLVRLGSTTHHYDPNARLVWLPITGKDPTSVTTLAPLNANLAPPGYYMLHVLINGVPSAANIINIS